ncbi:unnamed protein product [Cuscuta epithymum]|uniref:Uncharacterized protein n=1 Tax=Cuscuta epithymum TaxID=186058 RepID=A0AAV0CGD4_9ASTE|nr:unnamed protein product [Cuscuta epithymum]
MLLVIDGGGERSSLSPRVSFSQFP